MNLDIFDNPDPSGKFYKESYLQKNYTEVYDYIIGFCNKNSIDVTTSFKEKVYLCINNLCSVPSCKNNNCHNVVKFINSTLGFRDYCSNKCISSDPEIKKIKEEKSLKKWGTKTPAESKTIKDKIIKTNQKKYGANSAMCLKQTQHKSKSTLINNFGVDNPSKSKEILEKRIDSFKKSSFKENFKSTSLSKYGVEHPWMLKKIHDISIKKLIEIKNKKLKDKIESRLKTYNQYELIDIEFNKFKRNIIIFCGLCLNNFNINREDFYIRYREKTTICTNCNPHNSNISGQQEELSKFIRENYNGEILNNKKIIYPQEIDIYLPDLKLGFEFNGLWWHSEEQKGKHYHKNKSKKCAEIGIELIHIWGDDWIYKNDIVKSIILNRIGKNNSRIFARNCKISIVDNKESKKFLDENHILGNCKSNIKIALLQDNKIVSLMCFTKNRDRWELSRFCNKMNTTVIGSSSKLFKYFCTNYSPKTIISYSDTSLFTGEVYEKIGFKFIGESPVNYKWVITGKRLHKSNFRKSRLVESGYSSEKSESEIMLEDVGAFRVWDCGLKKWIFES
jgi:hypothetical protein